MAPFLSTVFKGNISESFNEILRNYNQYYFSCKSSISKESSNKPVYSLFASIIGIVSGTSNSIF